MPEERISVCGAYNSLACDLDKGVSILSSRPFILPQYIDNASKYKDIDELYISHPSTTIIPVPTTQPSMPSLTLPSTSIPTSEQAIPSK